MLGSENSNRRYVLTAISLHADCDIPVYCIISPSLSGLNLPGRNRKSQLVFVYTWILYKRRGEEAPLFDGELLRVAWKLASRLVDPAIGTARDEADDLITVEDPDFAPVRGHLFFRVVLPVSLRRRL